MPPRAVSQSVPRESTSAMKQPWENSGRAILGQAVTSALNAHSCRYGRINEEMTPEQYHLGCCNSQQVEEVADGTCTQV